MVMALFVLTPIVLNYVGMIQFLQDVNLFGVDMVTIINTPSIEPLHGNGPSRLDK